ncbi:MAG: hypothetical protein J6J79_01490 [Lachnospiraceae bacterium]|nr:hypothetical protein [Lachnospiraceae bacterium]
MKKAIQVVTYSGKDVKYNGNVVKQNSLHDIQSLDEFDINVIDLSANTLWEYEWDSTATINSISDFISVSEMITSRKKSKLVILYPQNVGFGYKRNGKAQCVELKNMLNSLSKKILAKLFQPLSNIELVYENTRTALQAEEFLASFYFKNEDEALLTSVSSNKPTAIMVKNVVLSTLCVDNIEKLIILLNELGLLEEKQEVPEWFSEISMFDDTDQKEIIQESAEKIELEQKKINQAQVILDKNNRLKSVLYTTGNELVELVFEIFEEILECDLSGFVDLKKEDLLIETEEVIFIGEIKGVNSNVKSTNISQVDTHYHDYLETHPEVEENKLKALLIINHQKNKAIKEREPVMEQQINLAKRNSSLIVETLTLLKVLELYRNNKVTKEKIISVFKKREGLLTVNDFSD